MGKAKGSPKTGGRKNCSVIKVTKNVREKEGILQMQPSGRWAICRPDRRPVEITSGELFRIEDAGELKVTRMEFKHVP